jgi:hypothetical protein
MPRLGPSFSRTPSPTGDPETVPLSEHTGGDPCGCKTTWRDSRLASRRI